MQLKWVVADHRSVPKECWLILLECMNFIYPQIKWCGMIGALIGWERGDWMSGFVTGVFWIAVLPIDLPSGTTPKWILIPFALLHGLTSLDFPSQNNYVPEKTDLIVIFILLHSCSIVERYLVTSCCWFGVVWFVWHLVSNRIKLTSMVNVQQGYGVVVCFGTCESLWIILSLCFVKCT